MRFSPAICAMKEQWDATPASPARRTRVGANGARRDWPGQVMRACGAAWSNWHGDHVPKGECLGKMVPRTNCSCSPRRAQDDDRGFGTQVADRAVALRDHGRSAGWCQAAAGDLSGSVANRAKWNKGEPKSVFRRSSASARCNAKTIRGGGDPPLPMASCRGREWARLRGASPLMRMAASWLDDQDTLSVIPYRIQGCGAIVATSWQARL